MARGMPAFWSTLVGLPFVAGGAVVYLMETPVPVEVAAPLVLFGLFVVTVGLYVQFVASPDPPNMREAEEIITTRHPTQRVAVVKLVLGVPLLVAAGYLLFLTRYPYVYPTVTLVVGLFLLSTGLNTYWKNSLTTYYVTTDRIIKEYRFVSLVKQEVPLEKVRGVQERRSLSETLVGLGNVRVASGGGRSLEVVVRNIEHSTEFADEVRKLL